VQAFDEVLQRKYTKKEEIRAVPKLCNVNKLEGIASEHKE
jgi:hypothetical protein